MPNDPYDLAAAPTSAAAYRRRAGGGRALTVSTAALTDHVCDRWHRRLAPQESISRGGGTAHLGCGARQPTQFCIVPADSARRSSTGPQKRPLRSADYRWRPGPPRTCWLRSDPAPRARRCHGGAHVAACSAAQRTRSVGRSTRSKASLTGWPRPCSPSGANTAMTARRSWSRPWACTTRFDASARTELRPRPHGRDQRTTKAQASHRYLHRFSSVSKRVAARSVATPQRACFRLFARLASRTFGQAPHARVQHCLWSGW